MKNEYDKEAAALLRNEIVGLDPMTKLREVMSQIEKQRALMETVRNTKRRPKAVQEARTKMFALRLLLNDQASMLFKLLNKVLPDLKSSELPAPTDDEANWMADMEKSLRKRLGEEDSSATTRAKH